jgi:chemotaxis protein methyltransferase CheR
MAAMVHKDRRFNSGSLMLDEVVPVEVVRSFRDLAARHVGLDLDEGFEPVIAARITKRVSELQLSLHSYVGRLQQDSSGEEIIAFWDFVRPWPARFFARWQDCRRLHARLCKSLEQGARRFRLWSAGCGSGEEAFTMALVAHNAMEVARVAADEVDLKILATDISGRRIEAGKRALFAGPQVWSVPEELRRRHFSETDAGFHVSDEIHARVVFRQLNLATPPFPMTGKMDAIFCEEGLRSLVPQAQRRAVRAARDLLAEQGLLRTGLAEEFAQYDDEAADRPAASSPGSQTWS